MPPDLFQYRLNGKGLYYTYTDVTPDHALVAKFQIELDTPTISTRGAKK
jgi:hypothetical protein